MNKKIGLIVLTAGIAITAGTGSQLSPEFKVEMAKTGDAHFRKDRLQRRHKGTQLSCGAGLITLGPNIPE